MADLNKVFILGRLTRDPEMKYMPSGSPVTNFGVATGRKWKGNDGQQKEETTFVDVDCFGKTAELVSEYMAKGSQILIEGRLRFRAWEGKDGQKRNKLSVTTERVTFLGGKNSNGNSDGGNDYHNNKQDTQEEPRFSDYVDDDSIPF